MTAAGVGFERSRVSAVRLLAASLLFWSCAQPDAAAPPERRHDELAQVAATLSNDEFDGRGAGTPGGRRAATYLAERMAELGLKPAGVTGYEQPFAAHSADPQADSSGETQRRALDAVNLIAVVPNPRLDLPPHDPSTCDHPLVVLTAHYDHLGRRDGQIFNGADDNASGVAAALRVASESIEIASPFHLFLALLDAEELGLQGARALLEFWPNTITDRIVANLNLDMLGRSDRGILWVAGAHHTPWLVPVVTELEAEDAIQVRGGRDSPSEPPDWTHSSDHAVFHRAGIPFLYFGVDDHPDYHRPTDDFERLDLEFLRAAADVVRLALEQIAHQVDAAQRAGQNPEETLLPD